ncbi:S8 family peptidase [Bradyrhizobium prioriisuperbiae]|uniref:S8 family peptidase n=1 Tax=Bradyrhizobium prioriisuperbiae TaxID=2854389 RepID=UPI0028E84E1E|nr:S8 family serine peptidase [Bradyrhizobium prioritasuperba]
MPEFIVLKKIGGHSSDGLESVEAGANAPKHQIEVHDIGAEEARDIAQDADVAAIARPMPVTLIRPFDVGAAPASADVWGLSVVRADTSAFSGDGVVVAVLDTGIDRSHPAFTGVNIVEKDFTGSGDGDRHGHGTHCAGTIFGRDVGGTRIGIARGVKKALIGKVLNDTGGGTSEMMFRGLQWALDQGAQVISMSLGFDFPGAAKRMIAAGLPEEAAVSNALESYRSNLRFFDALMQLVKARGAFGDTAVVVAASGNESNRPKFTVAASLPAAASDVVSVAALGRDNDGKLKIADFSNTMARIAAPGVDIVSAKVGGGLQSMSGTSMACPHVAGVAALWWEALKKSGAVKPTADLVVAKMMASAMTETVLPAFGPNDRGTGSVTSPQ